MGHYDSAYEYDSKVIVPKPKKKKHVGYFSIDASGYYCFHTGRDTDAAHIKRMLDTHVTGGPYTIVKAYAKI